jgi:hypothetical protein
METILVTLGALLVFGMLTRVVAGRGQPIDKRPLGAILVVAAVVLVAGLLSH